MARYGPADAFLLVGGKNLTGSDTFGLQESIEEPMGEARGIGQTWGLVKPVGVGMITLETDPGLYDDRAAGLLAAYQAQGETLQLVSYGMAGDAPGASAVMVNGTYVTTWKRQLRRDDLTLGGGTHTMGGTYYRGIVLHGIDAEAADGDTEGADSQDNGAQTTSGIICDLHVPALTLGGYTSVTITVRDSADDITYGNLGTFTDVTAAGSSQRITVAGTVERHLAIDWTFNGAGSGQSVTPYVVVYRAP